MAGNVGPIDRTVRVAVGVLLLSLVALLDTPWRWLGLAGLIPLVTGAMGYCPIYSLFGWMFPAD
jgi:hypothetical protein